MASRTSQSPLFEREDLMVTAQYNTFTVGPELESQDDKPTMEVSEVTLLLPEIHSKLHDDDEPEVLVWHHEARTIVHYAAPMCLTLLLQYSLTVSSILVVGHLGKKELGAVSLANMTAIITGYAIYQGFASSLDTLCPQAYGSGRLKLVGLHMQRLTLLLLLTTIPIAIIWLQSHHLFKIILPKDDHRIALLAGRYLRIVLIGAPGFACFEAGKRYAQAQGLFYASLQVLLVCAPLNAVMSWYFVWVC
jgi:MATE family multidrug resistance protein